MRDEGIVEAALFVAGKPVSMKKLRELVGSAARVRRAVEHLAAEYRQRGSAMEIVELEGRYVMQLRSEYAEHVKSVAPRELSSTALRTLAMVAYHQPITQSKLVQIRGNSIYEHLSELKEKRLITATPRGRTFVLTTGPAFSEYFNLKTDSPEEIRQKIVELAGKQKVGLDRWLHRRPLVITTPMYESLLQRCGVKDFRVSEDLYDHPEAVEGLKEASAVVLSRGYGERIREHTAGEVIEVSAATFEDLIDSMRRLQRFGSEKAVEKAVSEARELEERFVEKAMGLSTPVFPVTDMAARIAGELRLRISTRGRRLAPDYGTTREGVEVTQGADILIPTHQRNMDVVERITQRYQRIIEQIKRLEKG